MRASIIVIDGDKVEDFMTLQWATYTDSIIGLFSTTVSNEDLVDNVRLLCAEGSHASCFALGEDKSLSVDRVDPDFYEIPTSVDDALNCHLNGGSMGIMVNVQDKDYVTFFYYGHNDKVEQSKVAIDDLRDFYNDSDNENEMFLDRKTIWG